MLSTVVAVVAAILIVYYALPHYTIKSDLPRYGRSGVMGYFLTAVRFATDSAKVLQEGWEQFSGRPFMIPTLSGPLVIVGPEHIETLRRSDDTVLNQPIAVNEGLQLDHTLDPQQISNPYQIKVARTDLTRALASFIPEILEETELSMRETFDPSNDLKPVRLPVFPTLTHMTARISNRAMLGTELCRNDDFINKLTHFAETLVLYAHLLKCLPAFAKPAAYYLLSSILGGKKEPQQFLVPYLEQYLQERENPENRRNNISEFLIRNAPTLDAAQYAMRVLNLSFGSIHTSSIFLTHALFELAHMPESDLQSMRAEVLEGLESEGGWNKPALAKFLKIDSLLKEVGRFYGLGLVGLSRLAIREAILDDGTHIPKGHLISVFLKPVHFNPEIYPNPYKFDPFRFSSIREESNLGSTAKYGFTTINNNYLAFATGRHACPGRFFAAMELKIMIAHMLLNYDISPPPGQTTKPQPMGFNATVYPDPKAELIIARKSRVTATLT